MSENIKALNIVKYGGIVVNGISLPLEAEEADAVTVAAEELKRAGLSPARLHFSIYKHSADARKKNDIRIVYSVAARFDEPRVSVKLPKNGKYTYTLLRDEDISVKKGLTASKFPPLVVGMGPAGMFAALLLAENGYTPIIIDRGDCVSERCKKYENFKKYGILDTESNIQFGAGGAGTFSDGKLLTRINDPKTGYVLQRFCDFGAPSDILTSAKPHIGTDLLMGIVDRMLGRIEELGGSVLYRTKLERTEILPDGSISAHTSGGELHCSSVILATGHSSRDTYEMLLGRGFAVEPKPFSVGVRIEHLRNDIDRALYGDMAGHKKLGSGEYHLSDTTSGRGVYTFCMCPGGEVVAAASEEFGVVVNGMSQNARDGKNSNSAVAVSVRPEDHGGTPMSAVEFQRKIERAAYIAGGSDYSAPIMTVGDFLGGTHGSEPSEVIPTYGRVRCADVNNVLPDFVCRELDRGLRSFDRKLSGFASPTAVITAAETRTSAPVRILRGEDMQAIGMNGIYPCGEGAGYAGGITSAAIDGIKAALAVMERFAPRG